MVLSPTDLMWQWNLLRKGDKNGFFKCRLLFTGAQHEREYEREEALLLHTRFSIFCMAIMGITLSGQEGHPWSDMPPIKELPL